MSAILCCVALTLGKMLNNVAPGTPGRQAGAEISQMYGEHGVRFNYTRVGPNIIAEDSAYSTLSLLERRGKWVFAAGVVSEMSYSTAGWWLGQHYPNDGQHFSKSCRFCGSSYAVDWEASKHISLRMQYIEQNRLDPTYNGVSVFIVIHQ